LRSRAIQAGEAAGTQRPLSIDEVETVHVGVLDGELDADLTVERRQLIVQVAQSVLDLRGELPAGAPIPRCYVTHIVWISNQR
jgi:hypothetical protein